MFFTALLLLQSTALPTLNEVKLRDCLKLVRQDAKSGIVSANEWAQTESKASYFADICLASGYAADGKFSEAADRFQRAAKGAEAEKDLRSAQLWAQAGNAALSAGQASDALSFLNSALMPGKLLPGERIDALIDRTRAYVADAKADLAMNDLAELRRIAPDNGQGWLLSATLARRTGDLAAAQDFIKTAAAILPSDPAVSLEAGNIAAAAGAYAIARDQWQQTIKIAPSSGQAGSAKALLEQLKQIEAEQAAADKAPAPPQPKSR
jgi:tetratricopeptide (TPR) repeat protein